MSFKRNKDAPKRKLDEPDQSILRRSKRLRPVIPEDEIVLFEDENVVQRSPEQIRSNRVVVESSQRVENDADLIRNDGGGMAKFKKKQKKPPPTRIDVQ